MTATPRHILITGAGSGVGRGMALYLAAHGHRIAAVDLNETAAADTAAQIQSAGGQATAHRCDVTAADDVARLVAALNAPATVLVNNAGLQHVEKIETFPVEKFELLIDVMVKGPFLLSRALIPAMRQAGYGRIVNIGSIHSLVASKFKSAYITAKHGLIGMAKTLALETADADITVNTLCPSYILTPLVEKQIAAQAEMHKFTPEEVKSEIFLKPMPKKAFIAIDEIAALTEFLMSDAAKNITAQAIAIDGGWTAA